MRLGELWQTETWSVARTSRRGDYAEVVFGTDGGPLQWNDDAREQVPDLFTSLAADRTIKCVLIAGTGSGFCISDQNAGGVAELDWLDVSFDGLRLLRSVLSIPVPVIAAVNGPVEVKAELPLCCDVVFASTNATFRDPHVSGGIAPGDGANIVWRKLLGLNRSRQFLLRDQILDANAAQDYGLVAEVFEPDVVFAKARSLADELTSRSMQMLRSTRALLIAPLRLAIESELERDFALEGLNVIDLVQRG